MLGRSGGCRPAVERVGGCSGASRIDPAPSRQQGLARLVGFERPGRAVVGRFEAV